MIKRNFKFSIIVRTKNRKKLISRSINSILQQTYKDYEILIIDDNSSDGTEEFINFKYKNKTDKIKYHYLKKRAGNVKALEIGIKKSKGNIICFLDSDDKWHKNFLLEHFKVYDKLKDIDCVYNNTITIIDGKKLQAKKFGIEGKCYDKALANLSLSSQIALSFKSKCWNKIKKLDKKILNEDDDLCIRLSKYFKFKYIDKILSYAIHDFRSPGISSNKLANANNYEKLLNKYQKDIKKILGNKVIAKHYYILAKKFFNANKYFKFLYNFKKFFYLTISK